MSCDAVTVLIKLKDFSSVERENGRRQSTAGPIRRGRGHLVLFAREQSNHGRSPRNLNSGAREINGRVSV
jgi:hypothetical protein